MEPAKITIAQCETCRWWEKIFDYTGMCRNRNSTQQLSQTDSQYSCLDYEGKPNAKPRETSVK